MFLTRDALQKTLERYPRERQLVRRSYRCLCVMRGVIYYAKKVRAEEKRAGRMDDDDDETSEPETKGGDMIDRMGSRAFTRSEVFVAPSHALDICASKRELSDVIKE